MNGKSTLLVAVGLFVSISGGSTLDTLRTTRRMAIRAVSPGFDWSAVPSQGGFVKSEMPYVPEPRETIVRAVYDGSRLQVRMDMREPYAENLKGREKFAIWRNDVAEVFLQVPDQVARTAFWHVAVDCAGHVFVSENEPIPEEPGNYRFTEKKDTGITAAAELTADGWVATFAIPLSASPTQALKANFCRQMRIPGAFSSWSLTKDFCDMTRFGELVTEPSQDNGVVYERALADFQAERASTLGKFKAKTYPWKWAFGACDGYRPLSTAYSSETGFGWMKPVSTGETPEDVRKGRGCGQEVMSDLADRFVFGADPNEFRIDLPDGKYKVHLCAGVFGSLYSPHRRVFSVTVNGRKVNDFYTGDGHFCLWDFPVEVTAGRLDLGFLPHEVRERPETAALCRTDSFLAKGFVVNSIVVYPASERKAALKQIKADELEIRLWHPEELVNWTYVEPRDPEPTFAPTAAAAKRGWTLFSRPLGSNFFAGSRPVTPDEQTDVLKVRAAPGEKFQISFGVLPLRDADGQAWTTAGFSLRIREAMQMPWRIGDGQYEFEPYQLEEAEFVDHDLDAGVTRNIWLTGTVPVDAKPGLIQAAFAIGKDRVPVEIEVLPIRLEEVDLAWGGDLPIGYGRPLCYEDVVARACQDVGMNALVFNLHSKREKKDAFDVLKARIRLYQSLGFRGRYTILSMMDNGENQLRAKEISALPQRSIDDEIETARKIVELAKSGELPGSPELIYTAMDEAHCKGDPYWAEQVRLFKALKENVPGLKTSATESVGSYRRCAAYVDIPSMFEIPDFNKIQGFKEVWCYPNQAMLKCGDNDNAGRFCTGLLPAVTPLAGVQPWMVMCGHSNSTLAADPWEMLTVRGIGGFRVIPRRVTVLAEVGLWDLRYFATLRTLIARAMKGSPAARQEASRQQALLDMVKDEVRPSYMYYYKNGHLPAETFCKLRTRLTDGILRLQELLK